jgi:hypothetical protein
MTLAAYVSTPTATRADVRRFAFGVVVSGDVTCAAEVESR